jgi:uncharacterized membrane protein
LLDLHGLALSWLGGVPQELIVISQCLLLVVSTLLQVLLLLVGDLMLIFCQREGTERFAARIFVGRLQSAWIGGTERGGHWTQRSHFAESLRRRRSSQSPLWWHPVRE